MFGVGDCQRRLPKAEAALNGKAVDEALAVKVGEAAAAEVEPQEDIHASAAYRRALTGTLAERALKAAAARSGRHADQIRSQRQAGRASTSSRA